MVLGRNVHARGFLDDARPGEADIGRAHRELVGRTAQEAGHRPGEGIGVVEHHVQAAGFNVAAHGHGAARHLDHAVGALLDADARRAVHVGQEGVTLLGGALRGFHEFIAFGRAHGAAPEGAHEHGHHHLDVVDAGLEGHAAALGPGFFLGFGDALGETGEVQRIARLDFTVEFKDRTRIKDVFHVPFGFHGKVVAAVAAHAREFREQVRAPEVQAAVGGAVGAGQGAVDLVARREVVPLVAARIVRPGRKRGEFPGLVLRPAGQIAGQFAPGGEQAALEHFPFVVHFFHEAADLPLVLAVEVVLEADPGLGKPVPEGGGGLGQEGTAVARGLARKTQELLLAAVAQTVFGRRGQAPADVQLIQVGVRIAVARKRQAPEAGQFARGDDHLVRGPDDLLAQLAEKVEMPGPRAQGRFLHDAVDVAEAQIVLGRDVQVFGAVLDEFGRGALPGLEPPFDGRGPFRRNDGIIAVREHQALVGQADGLGPAGAALGNHCHNGHTQARHAVDVAGDLLGRAGVVLNGEGAGREDIGVDGDAFGFGHTHVLEGLGVAPGLDRTAVAEFRAVALFLPDDHHRLGVGLLAPAAGDHRAGDEHAGVQTVLVLAAHFREVVVDVFQNVAQADALGVAHDAHPVHGHDAVFQPALHIGEQILDRGQLRIGIVERAGTGAFGEGREPLFQQVRVVLVLARENVLHVGQSVAQALDAFFDIVVHNLGCAGYIGVLR